MASASRIYLDHNATAPMSDTVREAVRRGMEMLGNPSSIHAEGRAARAAVEAARAVVAKALGAEAKQVVFTSGGSEGAAYLLQPRWVVSRDIREHQVLLAGATEHACMLAGGRFAADKIRLAPVDGDGLIDLAALDRLLSQSDRPLLAIQHANNETGVLQPLAQIRDLAKAHVALFVCDAVQSFGKVPLSLAETGADALFLSAHKLGGPKGVGAIVLADTAAAPAEALIGGGGQQKGFRAGTENVAGILGFAAAVQERMEIMKKWNDIRTLRDEFETQLRSVAQDAVVFGSGVERLPNTSLIAIPGLAAERALIGLDLDGIAVSSGSACSSGKVKRSHVLAAMGVDEALAGNALRISLGLETTRNDVTLCLKAIENQYRHIPRNMRTDRAAFAA